MDERQALASFSALSQEHRLRIVRHLVTAGPQGVAAGALATAMGVPSSNVSFHLKELAHAGLVGSRREGRSIIYSADYSALSGLIQFLMKDCCGGHPEVCTPAITTLAACCIPEETTTHA
ncbi:ArsR/SmtB family transcription factor [Methylobacterium sp. ID0610]|uniref:ArsR/SmtB family transcription factor n=1 Tax=Methylobacterium carpenticola TaxID=3344827 RepID=UPI00367F2A3B